MCDPTTRVASAAKRGSTVVLAVAMALTLSTRSTAARSDPMRPWTITVHVVRRDAPHAVSRFPYPVAVDGRTRGRTSARAAAPSEHETAARLRGALGSRRGEAQSAADG